MATEIVKSGPITNRDDSPRVINNPAAARGSLKGFVGACAVANLADIGSTYIFGQIPSNAVVRSIMVTSPDIGTTTAMDIGLYRTTADGSAVVDADFFASGLSLSGGALAGSDVTHESGVFTNANAEKPLWEALSLTEDPQIFYDVVGTLTAAADAAGTVVLTAEWAE